MRGIKLGLMTAVTMVMAGCDTVPVPAPPAPQTISYATAPCFGACPIYRVTVSADGAGLFEGERNTTQKGNANFRLTPAQFADFRARLAPYRPVGERLLQPPHCAQTATDMSGVDIHWSGGGAAPAHLNAYYGCDRQANAQTFDALKRAVDALPIAAMIGAR